MAVVVLQGDGLSSAPPTLVAVVAGRRIDAPEATEHRFPVSAVSNTKSAVKRLLASSGVRVVVASAACGADLLALEAAAGLGIRTRILLPFERERFRATSVVDRGEDWGELYDSLLDQAEARGDVIVLEDEKGDDDAAYARATRRIIEEALGLARESGSATLAIAIWDEIPRAHGDATKDFVERATAAGMSVTSIRTVAAD
jgi:hypothetical protein